MNTSGLYFQLTQAINKNELSLPSLPEVALKIRNAVTNPEITLDEVTNIVAIDVALTHFVIGIANSPLFRGITKIENLHDAISRLGFTATKNLVFSYSIKSLFRAKRSQVREQLDWIWQHSQKVAAMSATLATHCRSLQAEKALLCGLFVNIGTIAILQFLQKKNDLPTSSTALWELVNPIADKAGTLILEHWDFEEDYCNVTRFRHHWDAENSTHISYVDVVLVAEALIHIPNHVDHIEDWFTHLPSRRKLALDGFPLTHPKLTEELQQEYQQNLQLLSI